MLYKYGVTDPILSTTTYRCVAQWYSNCLQNSDMGVRISPHLLRIYERILITMSKRRCSENWISPTYGEMEIQDIPNYIRSYYERMKEFDTGIHITIGTDSQNFDYTKEVNVIAVICEGHGGIFFYKVNSRDRISDVRTKLQMETGDSLEIAEQLISILETKEYENVFLNTEFSIHIDAGYSDKGKTKELIPELVGWVKGCISNCEVHVKPDSYVASTIADKISK